MNRIDLIKTHFNTNDGNYPYCSNWNKFFRSLVRLSVWVISEHVWYVLSKFWFALLRNILNRCKI